MHHSLHIPTLSVVLLGFILIGSSCSTTEVPRVWLENGRLQTTQGEHFIQGVCYHPVPMGKDKRSFETLTQDLALMQEMGINTIRVYEPIADKAVLDEIHAAGISFTSD